MNILCYLEPWVELGRPHLRYHNLRYQLMPQMLALAKEAKTFNLQIVMGEGTHDACVQNQYDAEGFKTNVLLERELRAVFDNYLDASLKLKKRNQTPVQNAAMNKLVASKLDGFVPDIVISFLSPVPFLAELFPNALILYTEFGIFSRAPLPRTFYFDAFGMFDENFISRFENELRSLPLTPEKERHISGLRTDYIANVFSPYNPFSEYDFKENGRFSHLVLLPLQFSNYFGFDAHCPFASQYDLLTHVMEEIDPDIGVIVTEHSGWEQAITPHNSEYLQRKYPNLIVNPVFESYNNASQFLLQMVDGVVSVSSSVGLQALVWDKPIFALGQAHLPAVSDCKEVSAIGNFLREKKHSSKDAILYELLMRYYPEDKYLNDGKWLKRFLTDLLDAKRSGTLGFSSYPEIDKPARLFKHLRSCVRISPDFILRKDLQSVALGRSCEEKQIASLVARQDELNTAVLTHDVISFDIFDTLLVRPFIAPHHLFLAIQDQARVLCMDDSLDFHELRRRAEYRARQKSKADEITLPAVYDEFQLEVGISQEVATAIMNLEIQAEIDHIQPRPYVCDAYRSALKLGRKVIIISDMYLDRHTVERMLQKCGVTGYQELYLSSEHKQTKARGGLYKIAAAELPDLVRGGVHIGDNRNADYINAKRAGIDAVLIEKSVDRFFENRDNTRLWEAQRDMKIFPSRNHLLHMSYFLGTVANKFYSNPNQTTDFLFGGNPYKLGYYGLGILFFSFTRHILRDAQTQGYNKLLFLSRDAYLIHKCYSQIATSESNAPQAHYVYASRRSYSVASLETLSDIYALLNVPFAPCSVGELLTSRFGLSPELVDSIETTTLTSSGLKSVEDEMRVTNAQHKQSLRALLRVLETAILENAAIERENFLAYLKQENIEVDDRTAIVDIGYAATSQRYLSKLTGTKVGGYYLITRLEASDYAREGFYINAFLGDNVDHRNADDHPFFHYTMMFESVFSSQEGSLARFMRDPDAASKGSVEPEFLPTQNELDRVSTLSTIQRGALDFVSDLQAQSSSNFETLYYSPFYSTRVFFHFLEHPTYADAMVFNGLAVDDTFSVRGERSILADFSPYMDTRVAFRAKDEAELRQSSEWTRGARAIILKLRKLRGLAVREESGPALPLEANPAMMSFEFIAPERMKDRIRRFKTDPYGFLSTTRILPLRPLKKMFRD